MDQKNGRERNAELLAPAGSVEGLTAALRAGADAVYMGGRLFGARAYADNADEQQMTEAIDRCHLHGRKLYMTVNTLLREEETADMLVPYLKPYYEEGLDGVLVQDLGVLRIIREYFPDLPVHASTQMSVQSAQGALFLKKLGVTRIVPARELSLEEVRDLYEASGMEIECFVHGALCYSYSGQCLLSSLIGGRSGNRGRCAQPCRQPYTLTDRQGAALRGHPSYLLSLKDIQTLPMLGRLIENGVYSFKIEGRMKRPEYAAGVTMIYRKYLDRYLDTGNASYEIDADDERVLMDLFNRGGFSAGYYKQYHGRSMMSMARPNHAGTPAAKVVRAGRGRVTARALEPLYEGDALENASFAGNSHQEFTVEQPAATGTVFTVRAGKELKAGDTLNRVRCEKLLSDIREKVQEPVYEKIKGKFFLREGSPAILKAEYTLPEGAAVKVSVTGQIPERARRNPTTEDDLRKQLYKTGGTLFSWQELQIQAQDGLFFPIAQINQMRREALEKLQEEVLRFYRRERPAQQDGNQRQDCTVYTAQDAGTERERTGSCRIEAAVSDPGQAKAVIRTGMADLLAVDSLYFMDELVRKTGRKHFSQIKTQELEEYRHSVSEMLSDLADGQHSHGGMLYLTLPPVWRKTASDNFYRVFGPRQRSLADGFILLCQDQLGAVETFRTRKDQRICAGSRLYAWNRQAVRLLREQGCDEVTAGIELNSAQLRALNAAKDQPIALMVYGCMPVMTSAQCLRDNTEGCRALPGEMFLRDKTGAAFPVYNHCGICTNVIGNSLPLSLADCAGQIRQIGPYAIRLLFTDESEKETERILTQEAEAFKSGGKEKVSERVVRQCTHGHFRRGVQ